MENEMGEEGKVYKVSVGRPKGKRPLGRLRRRWENGSYGDWLRGVEQIQLAQDRD
jgi:hypothetical protein